TGTGKTLAYVLPLLRMWKFVKDPHPRILILVPTRELTIQVKSEIDKLTTYMNVVTIAVYGGVNIKRHTELVMQGCDIVVATPGRLLDLLWKKALNGKYFKKLVIDEVDQMLILGFRTQLKNILDLIPSKRQNLLFSATLTNDVDKLLNDYFNNPIRIVSAASGTPLENITQAKYAVPNIYTKINLLKHLVKDKTIFRKVIVFVNTKKLADFLFENIKQEGEMTIGLIHSNKSQNARLHAIEQFDKGEYQLLIATDILARGIDLTSVSHVINFEIPELAESYIHRIGRTGRAEEAGKTISFVSESEEVLVKEIETLMNYSIPVFYLPEELPISEKLLPLEIPTVAMPNMQLKNPIKRPVSGPAFHEKSEKNRHHISPKEARKIKRKKRLARMKKRNTTAKKRRKK
ncbi:MAG TPA: DEAD/DEAH box helicase, partial [Phaeodactylibacter sp.]|nr:DEAD/DEAH box helicase [Phaeodactylibacter sp.]